MSKAQITYRFERQNGSGATGRSNDDDVIVRRHDQYMNEYEQTEQAAEEQMEQVEQEREDESSIDFFEDSFESYFEEYSDEKSFEDLNEDLSDSSYGSRYDSSYDSQSPYESPYDIETEQLEQLIRGTNQPSVSREERTHQSVLHSAHRSVQQSAHQHTELSEPVVAPELFWQDGLSRLRGRSPYKQWLKAVFSVAGAVATGIVFGLFVLSLFNSGPGAEQAHVPVPEQVNGHPLVGSDLNSTESMEQFHAISIPSKTYFVLQNGMFSSLESAENARQQLSDKGFASALEQLDYYYVYAGISANRDEALIMSHQLDEHQFETYIKILPTPAVNHLLWQAESARQVEDFFTQGSRLTEMMSSLAVIQLQQTNSSPIEPSFMATLTEAHQQWLADAAIVREAMPEPYKGHVQQMTTHLNTALLSLDAYRKHLSHAHLWQVQAALLDYVLDEKQLLEKLHH